MRLQGLKFPSALLCACLMAIGAANAAPPSKLDTAAPATQLAGLLKTSNLLVLGELHGTEQSPALVGDVVSQLPKDQPWIVGLELVAQAQPVVDRFLADKTQRAAMAPSPELKRASKFGVYSSATLTLLTRLRALIQAGAPGRVVLFDNQERPADVDRDQAMADRIRAVATDAPKAKFIVLTGNMHALRDLDANMLHGLADLNPRSVLLDAAKGDFWACMGETAQDMVCGRHVLGPRMSGCDPDAERATYFPVSEVPKLQGKFDALVCFPAFNAAHPPGDAPRSNRAASSKPGRQANVD